MKRFLAIIGVFLVCLISSEILAQEDQPVKKISEISGQTVYLTSSGMRLTDSDYQGNLYGNNENYYVTLYDTACSHPNRLGFAIIDFDIHPSDTLYIYDGSNTSSPLLYKGNNSNSALSETFYATGNCLTIRFISDAVDTAKGFMANIVCGKPCQKMFLSWVLQALMAER